MSKLIEQKFQDLLSKKSLDEKEFQVTMQWDQDIWRDGLEILRDLILIECDVMNHDIIVEVLPNIYNLESLGVFKRWKYILPDDLSSKINYFKAMAREHLKNVATEQAKQTATFEDIENWNCPICSDTKIENLDENNVCCPDCCTSWEIPEGKE